MESKQYRVKDLIKVLTEHYGEMGDLPVFIPGNKFGELVPMFTVGMTKTPNDDTDDWDDAIFIS